MFWDTRYFCPGTQVEPPGLKDLLTCCSGQGQRREDLGNVHCRRHSLWTSPRHLPLLVLLFADSFPKIISPPGKYPSRDERLCIVPGSGRRHRPVHLNVSHLLRRYGANVRSIVILVQWSIIIIYHIQSLLPTRWVFPLFHSALILSVSAHIFSTYRWL